VQKSLHLPLQIAAIVLVASLAAESALAQPVSRRPRDDRGPKDGQTIVTTAPKRVSAATPDSAPAVHPAMRVGTSPPVADGFARTGTAALRVATATDATIASTAVRSDIGSKSIRAATSASSAATDTSHAVSVRAPGATATTSPDAVSSAVARAGAAPHVAAVGHETSSAAPRKAAALKQASTATSAATDETSHIVSTPARRVRSGR
jgi:hypothetical protein